MLQQAEQEALDKTRGKSGGPRLAVELVWRNAKLNRRPHVFSNTWTLPRQGILELDYVAFSPPEKDPPPQRLPNPDLQVPVLEG